MISGHEEKHKQLVVENHELREILTYLLRELTMMSHGRSQLHEADLLNNEVFIVVIVIVFVEQSTSCSAVFRC